VPLFLPYQIAWIRDEARLKIIEKSRQIGITLADAYDSVRKVCVRGARFDVWVSSRDEGQARLYLQDCKKLAVLLQTGARDKGKIVIDARKNVSAGVLQFPTGRRIYSLSSNPNALAGKRGHVKLDEFALHQDQRLLYQVAKPVTQWGGQLCIISTHRGSLSVFNELIRDIRERGNPMGWSLHSVPLQKAVEEGLVERINKKGLITDPPSQEQKLRRTGERRAAAAERLQGLKRLQELHEFQGLHGENGFGNSFAVGELRGPEMGEPGLVDRNQQGAGAQTREEFVQRLRAECIDEEQWQQEYCCVPGDDAAAFLSYEMITACEDGELRLRTFGELAACFEAGAN
jgi:phage FluMu gp28-like protein